VLGFSCGQSKPKPWHPSYARLTIVYQGSLMPATKIYCVKSP
jgi:hypothetical protein